MNQFGLKLIIRDVAAIAEHRFRVDLVTGLRSAIRASPPRLTTLELVNVPHRASEQYRGLVDEALIDDVQTLGRELRGVRVLHLNSTAGGGGWRSS